MLRFPCQDYLNYLKNTKGFKKVNTISEWIRNPNNGGNIHYFWRI